MSDNQQFCLRWNNHQSTLVQVIDSLLSSGVLVDCTLAAEGQFLNAHKVVLCACSPYLEALLSQHYEKHPIVILKDVKFQELKSMMDYMYKGEVNISQDQLGQFLKAAESLQIKGLTDGGGENDSRDVGSTSQKRHEPTPVRKTAVPHQSRSPLVLPSHSTGLTIEPSKRTLPTHLSESQPDSPIRSREGSSSPTSRKRRRQRRPSQGDEDGHQDNSCDLPMQAQTMSITTVPTSIPPIPTGSSSTITKAPPPDDDSENPENDRLSGIPADGFIKEKIEPQPEMLIEPKTEYMEETNNDDSVEDLTLDDDDDYENMMEGGPGPSHSANNPNENYAAWQQMTGDRQDEAYLNPADTGHRDSQGCIIRPSQPNQERIFANLEEATLPPRPRITNVSSLATSTSLQYSDSLMAFLRANKKHFFFSLPIRKQLLILKHTNRPLTKAENVRLAIKLNVPRAKLRGSLNWYLNNFQTKQKKMLEDVSVTKMKILEDELRLSPTLSEDRLLLLSSILKIDRRVIQRFFNTEQDPGLEVIPIQPPAAPLERLVPTLQPPAAVKSEERLVLTQPSAAPKSKKPLISTLQPPAAPEASERPLLVPRLQIPRCCVPQERPADGTNSVGGDFSPEQGTMLRQRYAGGDSSDRHEANCVACRFGTIMFHGAPDDESDNSRPTTPSEEVPEAVQTMEPASDHGRIDEKASEEAETNPASSSKLNIPISLQSQLFEEYKKSPILDTDRLNQLHSRIKLSQRRITAYFSRMSSLIHGKTKNDFAKLLSPYPKDFLLKISARYHRSHHLTWVQRHKLARRLDSSTPVITDWFYNARLYELVSGSPFILRVKSSKAASPQVQRFPKESLSSFLQNHPANSMHMDALKAKRLVEEYRRDPNMTKERLSALAEELQVGQNDLRIWFEVNFPSGIEEANTETGSGKATAHSGSSESSLPEALFDAFKKSSHASSATLAQLASTFNMSPAQVHKTCKWFLQTRHILRSVASKTPIFEYEYRNKYLKPEHIRILEYEFQKHPYESIKLRNALSKELRVGKATIEGWFRNRRYFELILCGMPELFDAWKKSENAEDSDCQVLEIPPVAVEEAASFEQAKQDFEERLSSSDVSEVCALPNAPKLDTEFVFVSCTPSEIKEESSCPKIELIENTSDDVPESSFTSVPPAFLEPLVTVEEVKNPLEGQLPRYSFMSNRLNSRVTMIRRCSPSVDERPGPVAESIGTGLSENISAELSDTGESLPVASWNHSKFPIGKPLVDDSNFVTDVEEKLADSPHPLDVSPLMPLEVLADGKPGTEDPLTSPMPNEPSKEPNPRFNEPRSETMQLTSFQIEVLKKRFAASPQVNAATLQHLASALALSEKQILEFGFEKKRPKSTLSPFQSFVLEREYAANRKLTDDQVEDLCQRLKISNASIRAWFEKRRHSGNSEM